MAMPRIITDAAGHVKTTYDTYKRNVTPHCTTSEHTATHCNTLQHTATCCNTYKRNVTMYIHCTGICICMCVYKYMDLMCKSLLSASMALLNKDTPSYEPIVILRVSAAVRCSVLQCVAAWCRVVQYGVV